MTDTPGSRFVPKQHEAAEGFVSAENISPHTRTPPQDRNGVRKTLTACQKLFLHMVEVANSEISNFDRGLVPTVWVDLPDAFAAELTKAAIKLNNWLYAYCRAKWLDPTQLLTPGRRTGNGQPESDDSPIRIVQMPEAVWIYLPYLPPKQRSGKDIINDLLCSKLSAERGLPTWAYHHIAFHHVYPTDTRTIPRDVDNYAYKRTIDLIEAAMRQSDSGITCSLEMCSHLTDLTPPGVYIQISPKSSENGPFDSPVFSDFAPEPF